MSNIDTSIRAMSHRETINDYQNYVNKRTKLPVIRKDVSVNVWAILKDAIGKDLSKDILQNMGIDEKQIKKLLK